MQDVAQLPPASPSDANLHRSRLVDHFKRAYQIIVGLAIILACGRLFADGVAKIDDPALWLFGTFFITVVPIFHGGDRSLDIKYLGQPVHGFWQRTAYIWDVYMLLLTAIFFVKIAQAIPGPSLTAPGGPQPAAAPAPASPTHFYQWMAAMLVFDAFVLLADAAKSRLLKSPFARTSLRSYFGWIALNLMLAFACWHAAAPSALVEGVLTQHGADIAVFLLAFGRTVLDYVLARDFMFP